jgi:hypothetical protein
MDQKFVIILTIIIEIEIIIVFCKKPIMTLVFSVWWPLLWGWRIWRPDQTHSLKEVVTELSSQPS